MSIVVESGSVTEYMEPSGMQPAEMIESLFSSIEEDGDTPDVVYRNLKRGVECLGVFVEHIDALRTSAKCKPVTLAIHSAFFSLMNGIEECCSRLQDEVVR